MFKQQIPVDQFIANLPLFKEFAHEDLQRIAAGAVRVHAPRGTTVFRGGDPCVGIYAVLFGRLKLALHASQGSERVIDLMGPGQTAGEAAVFLDKPYAVTAEALEDSALILISKATVLAEADRHPAFARRIIKSLSRRVFRHISDLESYTLCSATHRVASYLLNDLPFPAQNDAVCVKLPAAKGVIASRLNLTQEHFSRILHDFSAAGLIEVNGRSIMISDADGLRECAA
ncbi:MAG: Crp/Fnr family transcriptional regulator [Betaproteobacteria bacterium]|nr:Crp/Fnr family transcriptional regulator [Betaproteobacteria bacterium]